MILAFRCKTKLCNQQYLDRVLCEHNESQQRLISSSGIFATAKKDLTESSILRNN